MESGDAGMFQVDVEALLVRTIRAPVPRSAAKEASRPAARGGGEHGWLPGSLRRRRQRCRLCYSASKAGVRLHRGAPRRRAGVSQGYNNNNRATHTHSEPGLPSQTAIAHPGSGLPCKVPSLSPEA